MENKVQIREFNEARDSEVVGKLEKKCELGSKNGVALLTNMMITDPLCRIRLYSLHIMLVAELRENRELVGVVRGCIKCLGTKFDDDDQKVKLGCILGLRISPRHRRMGIGYLLVRSIEEWMMRNGAQYTFLATEKNNVASTNLFTIKCNYKNFSSLVIFVQPVTISSSSPLSNNKGLSQDINIKIEKLQMEQAISLYNDKLRSKDLYPTDIDSILKEKLSLGTWVSYFKEEEEEWFHFESSNKENNNNNRTSSNPVHSGSLVHRTTLNTPSSWVMFSIWNSCEAYKIHGSKNKSHHHHHHHPFFRFLHATLSFAKEKIYPFLKMSSSPANPLGFVFLYGLYGEGERLGDLMKSVLSFASRMAENVKNCQVIMTELGVTDPLIQYVPKDSSISCIHDLWYLKKVGDDDENDEVMKMMMMMGQLSNVFVDPRDF